MKQKRERQPKEQKTKRKNESNDVPKTIQEQDNQQSDIQEQKDKIVESHEKDYKIPEEDINAMLLFTGLTRVPEFNESQIWTKAIAKVLKRDTSVSFCVLERTGWDTHKIVKIFGKCSSIVKVGKPIPIEVMPMDFVKQFHHADKQGRIDYLKKHFHEREEEFDAMDLDELKKECAATDLMIYLNENRQ